MNFPIKLKSNSNLLLIFLFFFAPFSVFCQCINSTQYGGTSAPVATGTNVIDVCNYASEYAPITGVVASTNYSVTSSVATDYITITEGAPNGTIIGSGVQPMNWTSTVAGTYYVHINADASCGTQAACRTTEITHIQPAAPMVITSTTSIHTTTTPVPIGFTDQNLVQIEIITAGTLNPIDLTQISLNMNGTTNFALDVDEINIYYTGNTNVFSPSNLFATLVPGSSNLTAIGSQTLIADSNYFWVSYDILPTATQGNFIDAEINQLSFSGSTGTMVPNVSSPPGNRLISTHLSTDPCYLTSTVGIEFPNSSNLNQTFSGSFSSCDLGEWTGSAWNGFHTTANINAPPPCGPGSTGLRALWMGSSGWTAGGEGFGFLLVNPLIAGNSYSLDIISISTGDGSFSGIYAPEVYSHSAGDSTVGANYMGTLPAAGPSWTANTFTFVATAAQDGDTWLIIQTGGPSSPTGGTGSGMIFFDCSCSATSILLPVDLIDFDVNCSDDKPILNWSTASENNCDYYTIERTVDGKIFSVVANVKGAGNSQSQSDYVWTDLEAPQSHETIYYRLSQTDFDGKTETFPLISTESCVDQEIHLFPNPAKDEIIIKLKNRLSSENKIEIFDNLGRTIQIINNNNEAEMKINVSEWNDGIYVIKVSYMGKSITQRFTKI